MCMNDRLNDEELRALLDEEARAAEAAMNDEDDGAPLPPHVKVSRPGWEHAKVLQVRLNPGEFDALKMIAEDRMLPMTTIAREQILKLIAEQ